MTSLSVNKWYIIFLTKRDNDYQSSLWHQMNVFLTIKVQTLYCLRSFCRLSNLRSFLGSICCWGHDLYYQFVLFVNQQFSLLSYFLQTLHCLVSHDLSSVKHHCSHINSLFVLNSSVTFKCAFTTSSSCIRVSSLSSRDCLDLAISSLAFCILSASFFCSASPSSSHILVFLPLVMPGMQCELIIQISSTLLWLQCSQVDH